MRYTPCQTTDPELWFSLEPIETLEAIRMCNTCPLMAKCLESALDNDERFGVWGGMDMTRRRRRRVPETERKTCVHCGQDYGPSKKINPTDWSMQRFCSRGCANRASHQARMAAKRAS